MIDGSTERRDPSMEAALIDLGDLMNGAKRGAFDPLCIGAATGLHAWISAALGTAEVDLDDPRVFIHLLQSVDAYAEDHPVTQKKVGKGSNYTATQAVGAIGWLIRIDDDRGTGRKLEERRKDAHVNAGIHPRQLEADRWQDWHHLGDAYLLYVRRVLEDPTSRTVILDRLQSDARRDSSVGETSSRWSRRTLGILALVAVVVVAAMITLGTVWALRVADDDAPPSVDSTTASALEQRYDGKDPRGLDGEESHCADPPASVPIPSSEPPVMGPDGRQVGSIQLRGSPACPTVVWARVLWNSDPAVMYQIPAGWTLHVVTHRPDTATSVDEEETASATPIPYGLSSMLTTARGCVYVEAYFTQGPNTTGSVPTSCVAT